MNDPILDDVVSPPRPTLEQLHREMMPTDTSDKPGEVTAVTLDPKNPARGLKKLEEYHARIALEQARTQRYKAQQDAKEARLPYKPTAEGKAYRRQKDDETKRDGEWLWERFVYLGKNRWLYRRDGDWSTASEEGDGFVYDEISNCGYLSTPPDKFTWETVWMEDSILRHAPRRTTLGEVDFVLTELKNRLFVSEVWDAAFWRTGVFDWNGRKVLNRANFKLVKPVASPEMPDCWAAFTFGLFGTQRERVVGLWREMLKRVHAGGLNKGWFQAAGLALASDVGGVGKSRFFHSLAKSFGAASPSPAGGYLSGDNLGCSTLLQEPVVELSDTSVPEWEVKRAQTKLLSLISNPIKEIRLMRKEVRLVPLSPLVCVSLNSDNVECVRLFNGLPQTVKEKWVVVACGNGTRALRDAGFDIDDLEAELPSMIGFLLSSNTPDEFLHEVVDGCRQKARFLVGHYFDPFLDLAWGPLGDLAPLWEDLQDVIKAENAPPSNGRYKVSHLRKLLLTLRDSNCDPTYKEMTPRAFAEVLRKLHEALPQVIRRTPVGDPKKGGWYEYSFS